MNQSERIAKAVDMELSVIVQNSANGVAWGVDGLVDEMVYREVGGRVYGAVRDELNQ